VIATEPDRGLFVGAFAAAGYDVIAVNRCRHLGIGNGSGLGAKSDSVMHACWRNWPVWTGTIVVVSSATPISRRRSR
jgi:hypothetical protein